MVSILYEAPWSKGYLLSFQRLVITTVTGDDDDKNTKEGLSLLGIISMLSKHLQATGTQYAQIHNWLGKICMEHQIGKFTLQGLPKKC